MVDNNNDASNKYKVHREKCSSTTILLQLRNMEEEIKQNKDSYVENNISNT